MANGQRDIVVIGASAGGVEALVSLMRQFTRDTPASFLVVSHLAAESCNHIVDALNTVGPLPAKTAEEGEPLRSGVIYIAPPDRHLLVKHGYLRVTRGPRENRWRPAIDPLFRSAAVAYGSRVIGVVLTGMLDDGTSGLAAIKRCGGIAIVQEPEEAAFPEMPEVALANVEVDYRLRLADMAATIERLVREPAAPRVPTPRDIEIEARIAETGYSEQELTEQLGTLTSLSCPECGGPLWERESGGLTGYRCRVGHAYGERSLLSSQDEAMESAVWAAVRLLEQRANVLQAMAEKDRAAERPRMHAHHKSVAREAREHADVLRTFLVKQTG